MSDIANNLYQLKKTLLETQDNIITDKVAATFIKNVTCAFAEERHFKEETTGHYCYPKDFVRLVLTLAKLDNTNKSIHTYLLRCKKCSISITDMEHFLYLLFANRDKSEFSSSFLAKVQDVLLTLHFLNYHSIRITYITDEKTVKKKLLFYIIADDNDVKITNDLTLSELQKKLSCDFDSSKKAKKIIL